MKRYAYPASTRSLAFRPNLAVRSRSASSVALASAILWARNSSAARRMHLLSLTFSRPKTFSAASAIAWSPFPPPWKCSFSSAIALDINLHPARPLRRVQPFVLAANSSSFYGHAEIAAGTSTKPTKVTFLSHRCVLRWFHEHIRTSRSSFLFQRTMCSTNLYSIRRRVSRVEVEPGSPVQEKHYLEGPSVG
jgi:hypothetical protein